METIFVKPKEGLTVLDPASGRAVPPEGLRVLRDSFWLRRLAEGDVVEAKEAAAGKNKGEA